MATFVDLTTGEEQARELVAFFNTLKKQRGEDEIELPAELDGQQEQKYLKDILVKLVESPGLIFFDGQEKDIENCFNVICSLLRKLDIASVEELCKLLISNITSNTTDRPLLRLKILNNLYNMFDNDSISRYEVFMSTLQFSLDSKNTDVIIPQINYINDWLKIWGTDLVQARALYKLVYQILEDANKKVDAYKVLLKYLHTFDTSEQEMLTTAKEEAVKAASQAVKLPEIHQCDELLEMSVVKQLENDPVHSKLFELLKLFACEKLEAFSNFQEKNPDYLSSIGISHQECLKKIRLLTLATLAAEHQELSYSLISQSLKVDESEVESWVILAINSGLIEAKMDQLQEIVFVNRSTQRVFSTTEWKKLGERLHAWRDNVRSLLQIVRTQRDGHSESHF